MKTTKTAHIIVSPSGQFYRALLANEDSQKIFESGINPVRAIAALFSINENILAEYDRFEIEIIKENIPTGRDPNVNPIGDECSNPEVVSQNISHSYEPYANSPFNKKADKAE